MMKTMFALAFLIVIFSVNIVSAYPEGCGYNFIEAENMRAVIYFSGSFSLSAYSHSLVMEGMGFNVTYESNPTGEEMLNNISDPNVKWYYGVGHGDDTHFCTGCVQDFFSTGTYSMENALAYRNPLTISFSSHCGLQQNREGFWLYENRKGDHRVVSARSSSVDGIGGYLEYGEYWNTSTSYATIFGGSVVGLRNGFTFEDAVLLETLKFGWSGAKEIRLPHFIGDVDYDMDVDADDLALHVYAYNHPNCNVLNSTWAADMNGDGVLNNVDVIIHDYAHNHQDYSMCKPRGWFI